VEPDEAAARISLSSVLPNVQFKLMHGPPGGMHELDLHRAADALGGPKTACVLLAYLLSRRTAAVRHARGPARRRQSADTRAGTAGDGGESSAPILVLRARVVKVPRIVPVSGTQAPHEESRTRFAGVHHAAWL